MPNEIQSFRSAVLGFDRSDVIDYIEMMAKERRDEVEAHRQAADVLRRERDEAREKASKLEAALMKTETERAALSNNNEELTAKRILCTELSERLSKVNSELIYERKLTDKLQETIKAYEEENATVGRAKARAADLELMAYKRAEAIEAEAMRNTEKARSILRKLITETKGKYAVTRGEAESVAYAVLQELNRLTVWFNEFPRLFDAVDDKFEAVQILEKPQIKTFVPRRFDEDTESEADNETAAENEAENRE